MTIDYSCLRSLPVRDIITALERDGFYLWRQRGSHMRYRHTDGRKVTVSFHHSGSTIPIGTLKRIIEEQARWNKSDLIRLKLLS